MLILIMLLTEGQRAHFPVTYHYLSFLFWALPKKTVRPLELMLSPNTKIMKVEVGLLMYSC